MSIVNLSLTLPRTSQANDGITFTDHLNSSTGWSHHMKPHFHHVIDNTINAYDRLIESNHKSNTP
ncbi:hypothetical protein JHK84_027971 [Glycine max]|nr:hypothetical protein JHK84_027971 [Glycine max]